MRDVRGGSRFRTLPAVRPRSGAIVGEGIVRNGLCQANARGGCRRQDNEVAGELEARFERRR
jgi:hypothetical protein